MDSDEQADILRNSIVDDDIVTILRNQRKKKEEQEHGTDCFRACRDYHCIPAELQQDQIRVLDIANTYSIINGQ